MEEEEEEEEVVCGMVEEGRAHTRGDTRHHNHIEDDESSCSSIREMMVIRSGI